VENVRPLRALGWGWTMEVCCRPMWGGLYPHAPLLVAARCLSLLRWSAAAVVIVASQTVVSWAACQFALQTLSPILLKKGRPRLPHLVSSHILACYQAQCNGDSVEKGQRGTIACRPPMYGCKISGIATLPSARWFSSSRGMRIRGEAITVLFRVWTKRTLPS
jgi:hypothetical protein